MAVRYNTGRIVASDDRQNATYDFQIDFMKAGQSNIIDHIQPAGGDREGL